MRSMSRSRSRSMPQDGGRFALSPPPSGTRRTASVCRLVNVVDMMSVVSLGHVAIAFSEASCAPRGSGGGGHSCTPLHVLPGACYRAIINGDDALRCRRRILYRCVMWAGRCRGGNYDTANIIPPIYGFDPPLAIDRFARMRYPLPAYASSPPILSESLR